MIEFMAVLDPAVFILLAILCNIQFQILRVITDDTLTFEWSAVSCFNVPESFISNFTLRRFQVPTGILYENDQTITRSV